MKIFLSLCLFLLFCTQVKSSNDYYCLSDGKKSILLVSTAYPNLKVVKYYPYLRGIKVSKPVEIKEVDMGDGAKPEIYRTMNEIIDEKVTGRYTFMSQGYLLYNVQYLNMKTNKMTLFNKETLTLEDINCL